MTEILLMVTSYGKVLTVNMRKSSWALKMSYMNVLYFNLDHDYTCVYTHKN